MNRLNYLQAMQKQDNPENDLGKALYRVTQLEAEIERLNKALEQMREIVGRYYDDCFDVDASDPTAVWGFQWEDGSQVTWNEEAPELAAWLKENR